MNFYIFEVLSFPFLLRKGLKCSVPDIYEGTVFWVIERNGIFGDFGEDIVVVDSQDNIDVWFGRGVKLAEKLL